MEAIRQNMQWEDCLLKRAKEIARHGFGRIEMQVQDRGQDEISILICAGESYKFTVKKLVLLDD